VAGRYGINPDVGSQVERQIVGDDARMGPRKPSSTPLCREEEAALVAFRKLTLLPLYECLYILQPTFRT
jgi:hypothetical protein